MQQFIDNWSGALLAPLTDSDLVLSVDPALAARLVGVSADSPYRLTLVGRADDGQETVWEKLIVTDQAAGLLTVVRGANPQAWPQGTLIEARVTAAALGEIQGHAYMTPANWLTLVRSGAVGVYSGAMLYVHPAFGALIDIDYSSLFAWIGATPVNGSLVEFGVRIESDEYPGLAFGVSRPSGRRNGLALVTGGFDVSLSAIGLLETGIADLSKIASAHTAVEFYTPEELSSPGSVYAIDVRLVLPGLVTVAARYTHSLNAGNWQLEFWSGAVGHMVMNTDIAVQADSPVSMRVELAAGSVVFSINGSVAATWPATSLISDYGQFGSAIYLSQQSSTGSHILGLGRSYGEVVLRA